MPTAYVPNTRESVYDMGCFVCVPESNYAIVQNFGKHSRIIGAGFNCLACPCEAVPSGGVMSLRIRQIDVDVATKTKDNVTINVVVAIQFCVHKGDHIKKNDDNKHELILDGETENHQGTPLFDAFYSLSDVGAQVNNYVENVIRGAIPRMELDEVFSEKDKLNRTIKSQLNERMKSYGYDIRDALITNLSPDARVAAAMNEINAQARMREAANFKADADKIVQVKAAQADAQSKYLSGAGVARQRKAIVDGLRSTVSDFSSSVKGATSQDVMDVLLMTQYFDMLKVMGTQGAGGTLFLPHGPHSIHTLRQQLSTSFNGATA
jgi:regulator of protease activity HflC (stomatin/prohibitin superfamily)